MSKKSIEEFAREIASEHTESEPGIVKIYWFPAENELRLVEVDTTLPPKSKQETIEGLMPFFFKSQGRMIWPLALELVSPEDEGKLKVPQGWVDWNQAKIIFER